MPRNLNVLDVILFGLNENDYNIFLEPYSPQSLKDIVSTVKNSLGNNILQQLVLDSAVPNKCSEYYMMSVLYAISEAAVITPDKHGFLPLHVAVRQMNYLMVEKLLTFLGNRIDVNAKNAEDGKTALHYAARIRGGQDMISLLIRKGADVNARDDDDNTPIFDALGYIENLKVLVENGADVNAKNKYEATPLLTLDEEQIDIAIFLIRKGANAQRDRGFMFLNGPDSQRYPNHNFMIDILLN